MLPTVAREARVRQRRDTLGVIDALDGHLFVSSGWLLLDAQNRKVRSVASRRAGFAAVGRGEAATVAGVLRPGVVVVDVDVPDGPALEGSALTEALVAWAVARGVWHLVRPSGGAAGRHHVVLVPGEHLEGLEDLVADLRRRHRVPAAGIDLRRGRSAVRPLSAPHRRGGCPRPLGDLHAALRGLLEVLPDAPLALRASPAAVRAGVSAAAGAVPEISARRGRRPLPAEWATYLSDGVVPDLEVDTSTRSTVELMATTALVRVGRDVDEAWRAIATAHSVAMTKARARGQDWWTRHVWNVAVATDNTWLEQRGDSTESPSPGPSPSAGVHHAGVDDVAGDEEGLDAAERVQARAAVAAARDALRVLQWQIPARSRAATLLVAHTQLDRLARTGASLAPCPERDLHIDTGLDRRTIRTALHALADAGLWEVVATFDPTRRDSSSHMVRLDRRFDDLDPGLSLNAPPVLHTPQPAPLPWGSLPPAACALWHVLPGDGEGLSTGGVAAAAGLTYGPLSAPTDRQRRTTLEHLHTLAAVGLAEQDEHGLWSQATQVSEQLRRVAAHTRAERAEQVQVERTSYRQGGGHAAWARRREQVLAQQAARARQRWQQLPQHVREARRVARRRAFFALSPLEQAHAKHVWATRRGRDPDSPTEAEYHQSWWAGLSEPERAQRSLRGQAWFARLAEPLARAHAAMWAEHRTRHHVPRARPSQTPTLAAVG